MNNELSSDIVAKWTGPIPVVSFWPGVPTRDLTREEWEAIEPHVQARIVQLGLYQPVEVAPIKDGE